MPKVTARRPQEFTFTAIRVKVPVRYEEEDIPNDFPFRKRDMWDVTIDLDDNGGAAIRDWPKLAAEVYMKVCDCGCYYLLNGSDVIASIDQDYVPNECIPGDYGDYIGLSIAEDGTITNWPKDPDYGCFFKDEDDDA